VLSLLARALPLQTGRMLFNAGATTSVPGPASLPAAGKSFDEAVLPHLDAAYRLARWLMRNEHDAEDVVQEASLRAFRYFRTFAGGNSRAWFLRIVRNACYGRSRQDLHAAHDLFDDEQHSDARSGSNPETLMLHNADAVVIERAMRTLPGQTRELLTLREIEGLSYRELGEVIGIPIGTVMSRLSRARHALRDALHDELTPSRHTATPHAFGLASQMRTPRGCRE
jgi:RNA polymerase sigma-70 factor (ECF subfamily)